MTVLETIRQEHQEAEEAILQILRDEKEGRITLKIDEAAIMFRRLTGAAPGSITDLLHR